MRVVLLALLALGGLTLGWIVLSSRGQLKLPSEPPGPSALRSIHRFPLPVVDQKNSRETPAVAVDNQGRILVAWSAHTADSERTIWLARSSDSGDSFSEPVPFHKARVAEYKAQMRNKEVVRSTSVVPRLASRADRMYLAWTEADQSARVLFYVAVTRDGGVTFSKPVCLHGSDAKRPAFTSLATGPDESVVCAWLDSRNGAQQPFCSYCQLLDQDRGLEALVFAGTNEKGVCPCCDTDVIRDSKGGTFVAFRNQDSGYRDIWIARRPAGPNGVWEPAFPVCRDRWEIDGCPHDGPSMVMSGDRLHVAWMDASTGTRQVYVARGKPDTKQFQTRALHPDGRTQGHPRLAETDGALYAVWDENLGDDPATEKHRHEHHDHGRLTGSGRAIMCSTSADGGETFSNAVAVAPATGAFQVNPALAVAGNGIVFVTWNETTEEAKTVVIARFQLPELSCPIKNAGNENLRMPDSMRAVLQKAGFRPNEIMASAPPLELDDLEGNRTSLAKFQGSLVLLNFWGTNCPCCLEELPALETLARELQASGLTVLCVCGDEDDPRKVRNVAQRHAKNVPLFVDAGGKARRRLDLEVLPTSFLVGPEGHLLGRFEGARRWSRQEVEPILKGCGLRPA